MSRNRKYFLSSHDRLKGLNINNLHASDRPILTQYPAIRAFPSLYPIMIDRLPYLMAIFKQMNQAIIKLDKELSVRQNRWINRIYMADLKMIRIVSPDFVPV